MKKLIVILFSLLLATSILANGFRGVKWGSGFTTIQKNEKNQKMKKKDLDRKDKKKNFNITRYSFKENLKSAGNFKVTYILLKDKLIKGTYSQKIKKHNFKNYNKMKAILIKKYGEPQGVSQTSFYEYVNLNGKNHMCNHKNYMNNGKMQKNNKNHMYKHKNYMNNGKMQKNNKNSMRKHKNYMNNGKMQKNNKNSMRKHKNYMNNGKMQKNNKNHMYKHKNYMNNGKMQKNNKNGMHKYKNKHNRKNSYMRRRQNILSWYSGDTKIDLVRTNNKNFKIVYYTLDKTMLNLIKDTMLNQNKIQKQKLMKDSGYIENLL